MMIMMEMMIIWVNKLVILSYNKKMILKNNIININNNIE